MVPYMQYMPFSTPNKTILTNSVNRIILTLHPAGRSSVVNKVVHDVHSFD